MKNLNIVFFLFFFSLNVYAQTFVNIAEQVSRLEKELNECESIDNIDCVKNQLLKMCLADQILRDYSKRTPSAEAYTLISEQDKRNTIRLQKIVDKYFWVKISLFGKVADNQAWLIAQHSDLDPNFQHKVLFILEKMVKENETDPKHYAYLYDRLATQYQQFGVKQLYGTQATIEKGEIKINPYEGSVFELDQRRKKINLPPIKEYTSQLNEFYN